MMTRALAVFSGGPARVLVATIRAYQYLVSPWFGPACRYFPSCSEYAVEAVSRFGVVRGTGKFLRRLSRCHPLGAGGVDLVD